MEPTALQQHIETLLSEGARKSLIAERLTAVGWTEDQVEKAYAAALITRGTPVPTERAQGVYGKKASTLDVVMNFFSFILLGITATALGTLYFQIINKYFPDTLAATRYYGGSGMNTDAAYYAIAALIVAYPLYYLVMRMWFKRFREDEAKVESRLTKWLTYLVLLVASVVVVGDLIAVLNTFFRGEITARFFLKALTILVIAGMVCGFYVLERKRVQFRHIVPRRTFQLFGYVLSGLVLLGVVLGFVAAGSPTTERMRTFDERRSQNLSALAGCIDRYAEEYERLPATLADLSAANYSHCVTSDPETKESYEYQVIRPLARTGASGVLEGAFELCADFALAHTDSDGGYYNTGVWYTHDAGRSCDTVTVSVRPVVNTQTQKVIR